MPQSFHCCSRSQLLCMIIKQYTRTLFTNHSHPCSSFFVHIIDHPNKEHIEDIVVSKETKHSLFPPRLSLCKPLVHVQGWGEFSLFLVPPHQVAA